MALTQTKRVIKAMRNATVFTWNFTSETVGTSFDAVESSLPATSLVLTGTRKEAAVAGRDASNSFTDYVGTFDIGSVFDVEDKTDDDTPTKKERYVAAIVALKTMIELTEDDDERVSLLKRLAIKEAKLLTL